MATKTNIPPVPVPITINGVTSYVIPAPPGAPKDELDSKRSKKAGTKDDYYVPGAGPTKKATATQNNGNAVRLTPETDPRSPKYKKPPDIVIDKNLLHNYRSFNYNFTLAALSREQSATLYFKNIEDLSNIVLSSKGKGPPTTSNKTVTQSQQDQQAQKAVFSNDEKDKLNAENQLIAALKKAGVKDIDNNNYASNAGVADLRRLRVTAGAQAFEEAKKSGDLKAPIDITANAQAFNKSSPGRFDMFIDDVEIESLISNNKITTTSMAYGFKFNIIEPYSVFGFIDALLEKAQEAGWSDYAECVYCLALDFIGYKDNKDLPIPEKIPNSTRFFPIRLYSVETSITERGTIYTCRAIPAGDATFSKSQSQLKRDIKLDTRELDPDGNQSNNSVASKNVGGLLRDMATKLTQQEKETAEAAKAATWSSYRIEFPKVDEKGNEIKGVDNEIAQAIPRDGEHAFPSGNSIKSVIDAVIASSTYMTDVVKASAGQGSIDKHVDAADMMKFYRVVSTVEYGNVKDGTSNNLSQTHVIKIYVAKTSYHRANTNPNILADFNELRNKSLRRYDYVYTGLNTDILDFKADFNLVYFSAVAPGYGGNDQPKRDQQGKDNSENPQGKPTVADPTPKAPPILLKSTAATASSRPYTPNTQDAWQQHSYNTFQKIINAPTSMFQADITILGDPIWIISGNGSQMPDGQVQGKVASNGEASALAGDVLVQLNFFNPSDIDTKTGLLIKNSYPVAFSGIFQVINIVSHFKDGVFKQLLTLSRIPAEQDQPAGNKVSLGTTTNESTAKAEDSAPPTATAATNEDTGIVTTAEVANNQPPQPEAVANTVAAGFTGPAGLGLPAGNIVTVEGVRSIAEFKSSLNGLQATLRNPLAGLQNELQSQLNIAQSTIQGEIGKVTGPITNSINSVQVAAATAKSITQSPLKTLIG